MLTSASCLTPPAAYALGFLDCKDISARCMLTIFQFFATKTDASVLRMLCGSPAERLLKPITEYVKAKGGRIHLRQGCKCVSDYYCPILMVGALAPFPGRTDVKRVHIKLGMGGKWAM